MTPEVFPVPADMIPALWAKEGARLSCALRHGRGEYAPHHIRARLENGRWTLFVAVHPETGRILGLAAVEVVSYEPDTKPHLWVIYGAGEDAKTVVPEMWPALRAFAARAGCAQVRFLGRPGWARSGAVPATFKRSHDLWSAPVED